MNRCKEARTALQVIGRDYISHSAIATYQQCPLRFRFRYVDRIPESEVSSSLVFGAATHRAIEFHFTALAAGLRPPGIGILLRVFWAEWNCRSTNTAVRIAQGESVCTIQDLAERVLLAFLLSTAAKPDGAILGVEKELRGRLVSHTPDLLARVDLLTSSGDDVTITEFKTSRARWSEHHVFCAADQLLRYAELVQRAIPHKQVRTQFVVITKSKTPVVERHAIKVCDCEPRRSKRIIQQVWKLIQRGQFYPSPSPFHCVHCPYRAMCREWA